MATQQCPTTLPVLAAAFRAVAAALCNRFGESQERIARVLGRIARSLVSSDSPDVLDIGIRSFVIELVEDALIVLPPEKALSLLELGDVSDLVQRVQTFDYLADPSTPLYTMPELAGHLDAFREFLGRHEKYLIQTGLPPEPFRRCRWLYDQLGRLYDTRCTGSPFPASELFPNAPTDRPYRWLRYSPKDGRDHECEYDDSSFLRHLKTAAAIRLEELREKLYRIKAEIVKRIAEAAICGRGAQLWDDCLEVLTGVLHAEDANFLFKMDILYVGPEEWKDWNEQTGLDRSPGGLTSLLLVAGHVEKELTVGTLAVAKAAIGDVLHRSLPGEDTPTVAHRYMRLIAVPGIERVNRALDDATLNCKQDFDSWSRFKRRALSDCKQKFRATIEVEVLAEHAERISPILREYARELEKRAINEEPLVGGMPTEEPSAQADHAEAINEETLAGAMPTEESSAQTDRAVSGQNVFHFDGAHWKVRFRGGEDFLLPNLVGAFYIYYLLNRPRVRFHPVDLRHEHEKLSSRGSRNLQVINDVAMMDDRLSTSHGRDMGNAMEPEGIDSTKKVISEFEESLKSAEEKGQVERVTSLRIEIDKWRHYLSNLETPSRRPRILSAMGKKARDQVCNAVAWTLTTIEKKSKPLHNHLERSLFIGVTCYYEPESEEKWDF